MNYSPIYEAIIERAKYRDCIEGITEKHHIIPISYGGSNKKSNKVKLTPKEHHVCHLLLVKMGMCKNYWFTKMNNKKYEKMKKKEKLKLL